MRIRHHKKYLRLKKKKDIKLAAGSDTISKYPYFVMVEPCREAEGEYTLHCTSLRSAKIAAEHDYDRWTLECLADRIEVSVWERTPRGDSMFIGEIQLSGNFKKRYKGDRKKKSRLRRALRF